MKPEAKAQGFPAPTRAADGSGATSQTTKQQKHVCYQVLIVYYLVLTVYYLVLTVYCLVLAVC